MKRSAQGRRALHLVAWLLAAAAGCGSISDSPTDAGQAGSDASSECSGGRSRCGGACVDLTSDPENCGACGVTCSPDATCEPGPPKSTCECAEGFTGNGLTCETTCGDGIKAGDEVCDDGANDACGACNADCTAAGTGPPASGDLTFNNSSTGRDGTVQTFDVPDCVYSIHIEAWGAQGGGALGGKGAHIAGDFDVTPGETLNVLVGQRGTVTSQGALYGAGGGGGTFVYRKADDPLPLIAAGGGGGQASNDDSSTSVPGGDGSASETPTPGTGTGSGPGGSDGHGGGGGLNVGSYSTGGGGCGWLTDGADGLELRNPKGKGGQAPRNGALGGLFTHPNGYTGDGGYGGGGGNADNSGAGGGGGGYNGGGGGNNYTPGAPVWGTGGGGGSYNGGTNQTNEAGVQTGHGKVVISW